MNDEECLRRLRQYGYPAAAHFEPETSLVHSGDPAANARGEGDVPVLGSDEAQRWPGRSPQKQRLPDEGDWRPGGYRSGGERAIAAQVLFSIGALTTFALALVQTQGFELLDRAERFVWAADAWLEYEETLASVSSLDELAWQVAGISLIVWLSRYVDNIPALGGGVPKRSPARVIVYWIVPIINLVFLPLILRDAGRRMAARHGDHVGLIVTWWLSWSGWLLVLVLWVLILPDSGGLESQRQSLALDIVVDTVFVIQALLSIAMVRRMQADENLWAADRGKRSTVTTSSRSQLGWDGDLHSKGRSR